MLKKIRDFLRNPLGKSADDHITASAENILEVDAELPKKVSPIIEACGYKPLTKAGQWKRSLGSHSILLSIRQLRWMNGTLQWKVTLKGVPGFLGVSDPFATPKPRFASTSSVFHLSGCCVDREADLYKGGFPLKLGTEVALRGFKTSLDSLRPTLEELSSLEGVKRVAQEQIHNPKRLDLNKSFPDFVLAVSAARDGQKDVAFGHLEEQLSKEPAFKADPFLGQIRDYLLQLSSKS